MNFETTFPVPKKPIFFGPPLPPCPIPPYLLPDILMHLPLPSLLTCRGVCRDWKHLLATSLPLKRRLFTALPAGPPRKPTTTEMHPVFRTIDYHLHRHLGARSVDMPLKYRIDFRLNRHTFWDSGVVSNFATSPATRRIKLRLCGGELEISHEAGVTVWRLMEGLDELVKERHGQSDGHAQAGRLQWDCITFPFAGFRIVSADDLVVTVKPEFLNLVEVTRTISRMPMVPITSPPLITFDVEHEH